MRVWPQFLIWSNLENGELYRIDYKCKKITKCSIIWYYYYEFYQGISRSLFASDAVGAILKEIRANKRWLLNYMFTVCVYRHL